MMQQSLIIIVKQCSPTKSPGSQQSLTYYITTGGKKHEREEWKPLSLWIYCWKWRLFIELWSWIRNDWAICVTATLWLNMYPLYPLSDGVLITRNGLSRGRNNYSHYFLETVSPRCQSQCALLNSHPVLCHEKFLQTIGDAMGLTKLLWPNPCI